MLQFLILQDSQLISHGDAVISAQSGAVRMYDIPLHKKCERILLKIMCTLRKLFTNHIHMALQDHCRGILIPRGCLLKYDHIAAFILNMAKAVFLCKSHKIIADLLRIAGTMGDFCNLLKIMKHSFRFQIL